MRYALLYGADAVYLGAKEFGMRSSSDNFTSEELFAAVDLCHSRGKKLFCTLNTLPSCEEIERLPKTISAAAQAGIDAFIVADLGVLALVKQYAPNTEIHLSTQAGITNHVAACEAYKMGAQRVVLARELTLEDIAYIRANTPQKLGLEVFVHGAMCMSVSGRCLLSNYMTGRDANRGRCAQSCRWKYHLTEEKRPGQQFELGEDDDGSYILSADDLCTISILDKIVQAGADSLKIEGRSKSFYYVASATAAYRSALDAVYASKGGEYHLPEFAKDEVGKISHRPYSNGFFLGKEGATQSPREGGSYIRTWQPVGVVQEQQGERLLCRQRGKFSRGETVELLLPQGRTLPVSTEELWNEEGAQIEATPQTGMLYFVKAPEGAQIPPCGILRRKL